MIQVAKYLQTRASHLANDLRRSVHIAEVISGMIHQRIQRLKKQGDVVGHDAIELAESGNGILEI